MKVMLFMMMYLTIVVMMMMVMMMMMLKIMKTTTTTMMMMAMMMVLIDSYLPKDPLNKKYRYLTKQTTMLIEPIITTAKQKERIQKSQYL